MDVTIKVSKVTGMITITCGKFKRQYMGFSKQEALQMFRKSFGLENKHLNVRYD